MKKGMTILAALPLAVSLCAPAALAAGRGASRAAGCSSMATGQYYVDANGDGVCDHRGTACTGQGRYYVDADGDGVCDHLNAGSAGCTGSYWGHGRGGCRN